MGEKPGFANPVGETETTRERCGAKLQGGRIPLPPVTQKKKEIKVETTEKVPKGKKPQDS